MKKIFLIFLFFILAGCAGQAQYRVGVPYYGGNDYYYSQGYYYGPSYSYGYRSKKVYEVKTREEYYDKNKRTVIEKKYYKEKRR